MAKQRVTNDQIEQALELGKLGALGLADSLLPLARGKRVRFDFADDVIVVKWAEQLTHFQHRLPTSAFRAALARIAVLCGGMNERAVSPYRGNGVLSLPGLSGQYAVSFSNTPAEQWLEVTGPGADVTHITSPIYTVSDAARYLRIPAWVAIAMSGMGGVTEYLADLWRAGLMWLDLGRFVGGSAMLSFLQLSQVFALTPVVLAGGGWPTPGTRPAVLSMPDPSPATINELLRPDYGWGEVHSPASQLGAQLTNSHAWSSLTGAARELASLYAARVDIEYGLPARLYPFTRPPAEDAPRIVTIDPKVLSGRPSVDGVSVDTLLDRFHDGASPTDLAADARLTADQVAEVLRYGCGRTDWPAAPG